MSNSPKLSIPAYELLQVLYRPEKAAEVYEAMTPDERKKINYILTRLSSRKESDLSRDFVLTESLPNSIVEENFDATQNICEYLRYLGYKVQSISSSLTLGVTSPVLIVEW